MIILIALPIVIVFSTMFIIYLGNENKLPQVSENTVRCLKIHFIAIALILLFLIAYNSRYNFEGRFYDKWTEQIP